MGSMSIWHWIIIGVTILPAFLPLLIKRPTGNRFGPSSTGMGMGEAIQVCLKKYADFNGRASRSEFWWFFLFYALVNLALSIVSYATNIDALSYASYGFIIPSLAVGARRLHDINRSGWWQLITFGFGYFTLIFLWAQPSQNDTLDKAEVFD